MKHVQFPLILMGLFFLIFLRIPGGAQTSPEDFLTHPVGADGKLADYGQIREYFQRLDAETDRMKLLTIGKTGQGRPLIMAVISTAENIAKSGEYREIARRLRDQRDLTEKDARTLAAGGRTIMLITCSLHATEIGASQMSMELAHRLVTGKTPYGGEDPLEKTIVLLVPALNPDGIQMVTQWYRKYKGTQYEGGSMPWLYHPYAGHDNNRDWFMGNLPETRALMDVLYRDWIPQIHVDEHQMGSTRARLFLPPFMDPPTSTVHPLVWRGVALCGTHMAYRLQEEKRSGVVHGRSFTGWWIGACDDTSWLHNSVGILSEAASVRIASPIYVEPGEIPDGYARKSMQFPNPWKGGWWRLRDIVDYELNLSFGLIEAAAIYRDSFLFNFYRMCGDERNRKGKEIPTAFLIPATQHDSPTTRRMLRVLQRGGVEIHRALEPFFAARRLYPKGTWVVGMDQPYRPYAQALMERQRYPDIRQYPGGPPIPPYDNAGWTLPLQMGVECVRVEEPFSAKLEKIDVIVDPEPEWPEAGGFVILKGGENAAYAAVFSLLSDGVTVRRVERVNHDGDDEPRAGDFVTPWSVKVRGKLVGLQKKYGFSCGFSSQVNWETCRALKYPRIGLYRSWRANMDEGWTRYMLDDFGIRYETLRNADFKGGKDGAKRLRNFDVIIFASEDKDIIKGGEPAPDSPWKQYFTPLPPGYQGGIGKKGVEALHEFVRSGGHLIALNSATELVLKEFNPPVRNVLKGVKKQQFFCPMSILTVNMDSHHPLGLGLREKVSVVFSGSPAYATWVPRGDWGRKVVAAYPEREILESGWLLGENHLARKAALVDLSHGKGRIVLFGFRPQNRAQTHGTYKILFNAFLRN